MERTLCIKIQPDTEQAGKLQELMRHYAKVCDFMGVIAGSEKIKDRKELHERAYRETRLSCESDSQITCLALRQVIGAYKTLSKLGELSADADWPTLSFSPKGSVPFDQRTYRPVLGGFSLYTKQGRIVVPSVMGKRQTEYLQKGNMRAARLVHKRGKWYMHISIRQGSPVSVPGNEVLGVDVGEVNIAATSSGEIIKANSLRHDRDVYLNRRTALQRNGSQSAKSSLRKASGREARHVRHANHVASKQVVAEAINAKASVISMEDLTHIRDRIRMGKRMRSRLHRWAWRQLQDFIAYKANEAGIAVVYVDPAYTSKTCSECSCLGTRTRSKFACSCGNLRHADANAASNIRKLALPIGGATPYVTAGQVA